MQDVNVLVVFPSPGERLEQLAQAAAVGAVQGRANIRLRCLQPAAGQTAPDTDYIAPRDSDVEWADAIVAGVAADARGDALEKYFGSLGSLRDPGRSKGKIGASFTEAGSSSLQAAMNGVGLITIAMNSEPDALTAARMQGRRVAEVARAVRRAGQAS